MNSKFKVTIGAAVLSVLALLVLTGVGSGSNAGSMNMEERFNAQAADTKLSPSETAGNYTIDPRHSYIGFRARHMGLVDVPGSFTEFKGVINFDSKKIQNSTVEFSAQAKSIDTRVEARNNHLRSKDFFEVETYPEITFKSKRVTRYRKQLRVYGDLTIKDVTREVMIPFKLFGPIEDARGNVVMGVEGEAKINRRQFNVNYGTNLPNGTAVISDLISIDLQLESVRDKQ